MRRIVFFGLDGSFSTIALRALVHAELSPRLVIVGEAKPSHQRGETVSFDRAEPRLFGRMLGRRRMEAPSESEISLRRVALGLGIDTLTTSNPGALRARARIREMDAEVFVVAGFHRLLPSSVLELSKLGGLNLHPGRLPGQRGPAPVFWALREGRNKQSFTIHMLDAGEDSGDIVMSGEFEFAPGTHGREIHAQCAQTAVPHLVRAVRSLVAGDIVRMPQAKTGIGRCPRPEFRDCRIDPKRSSTEVLTFVGGCAGVYPLFVECGGDRFFIESAISHDPEGQLSFEYALTGDRLLLQCSPGVVELELRPEGALFTAEYVEPAEENPAS